jgi:hypothetical protein
MGEICTGGHSAATVSGLLIPKVGESSTPRPGCEHTTDQKGKGGRAPNAPGQSFPGALTLLDRADQYIPPMPPPGAASAGFSSFLSTTTHSVVRSKPAIDAAFWSAVRVTLVGSITPAFTKSS